MVRALGAYLGSVVAEWALWVAVLVYAHEKGGSRLAGVTAVALLLPAAVVAPWAGRAADGARPDRVLFLVYLLEAVSFASASCFVLLDAPSWAVILAVGVAVTGVTFVRPALAVVVPGIVVTPADLVAANLLTGNADSISVLAGPLFASALLVADGPALVFGACAVLNAVSAALTLRLVTTRGVAPASGLAEPSAVGRTAALIAAMRAMGRQRGSISLLIVLGAQYALIGALDLLVVNLAFTVLDLGDAGPGVLSALFGVGAVAGGAASVFVLGRRHLSNTLISCLVVIAVSMATLGASMVLVTTALVLPIVGVARSLLDVSGRMLLQRCAPQDSLASVFAVLEALAGAGMLCGSLMVQVLIAQGGPRLGVIGMAVAFVLVLLLTAPALRHVDEHADAPVVQIRLLRSTPLFRPLPGPELESLARAAVITEFETGTTIVREGEPGDHYFVIADGTVEVNVDGARVRTIGRPSGFGEIALLASLPRTATVTAVEPVVVLAIERSKFLEAVLGHDASASIAWALARTLHPPLNDSS